MLLLCFLNPDTCCLLAKDTRRVPRDCRLLLRPNAVLQESETKSVDPEHVSDVVKNLCV